METKTQEWIEQTEVKIREVFELFDKDKTESIVQVFPIIFKVVNAVKTNSLMNLCRKRYSAID